jgi:short-subunit dehydrogenase
VRNHTSVVAPSNFSRNGAKVYLVGRTEEKLERAIESHKQGISGELIHIQADISKKEEIKRLVQEIESREKCLCILINNAGISSANQAPEGSTAKELRQNLFDPENATFEDWTNTYRTNVAQCYFLTTAFLPLLQKATEHQHGYSGTVINIG